jgi:hypothetical protein
MPWRQAARSGHDTHTFTFDNMARAFKVSDQKLDDAVKPLIVF